MPTVKKPAAKKPSVKQTLPQQAVNEIAFVLDCSGSMEGIWPIVIKVLKDNFNAIRSSSIRFGQITNISLFVFGDWVKQVAASEPIQDFKLPDHLLPNMGMTSLYKATLDATNYLNAVDISKIKNKANMVIVLTDGEDNMSSTLMESLRGQIQKLQKTDRWSFAFMVPPGAEGTITHRLGLPPGNVQAWENTVEGTRHIGATLTNSLNSYYVTRSTGQTSTKGFFVADLSQISASDVKKQLSDISSQVKVLTVPKEIAIKEFVEQQIGEYRLGAAYYMLSKDELVQGSKDILVMEKGKKKVWAGTDTRKMLGLPVGDVKIRPGNLSNFEIFVQSSSVNRKLVRGTKLIVVTA